MILISGVAGIWQTSDDSSWDVIVQASSFQVGIFIFTVFSNFIVIIVA
jgi:hypothetical protein